MNTSAFIEDDDLALYALGLLSPSERTEVEARLTSDTDNRLRLAKMQSALGVYAQATVEMQDVPDRSLDRLMSQIKSQTAHRPVLLSSAHTVGASRHKSSALRVLPWTGWALAAGLACAIALALYPRQQDLKHQVAELRTEVQNQAEQAARVNEQKKNLEHAAEQQTQTALDASAKLSEAERRAADLRDAASRAVEKANSAAVQTGVLAATASQTAKERDALASSLQAQTQRNAEIASDAADAQLILNALKDPSALNVSLTVPKQKKSPSGRGTYVAGSGTLIFVGTDLPTLADNRVYELWLMPANGASPIAAGTFVPDASGRARLVVPRFRQGIAANGFAVTAEKAGGSSTPTLPILLAGS